MQGFHTTSRHLRKGEAYDSFLPEAARVYLSHACLSEVPFPVSEGRFFGQLGLNGEQGAQPYRNAIFVLLIKLWVFLFTDTPQRAEVLEREK